MGRGHHGNTPGTADKNGGAPLSWAAKCGHINPPGMRLARCGLTRTPR